MLLARCQSRVRRGVRAVGKLVLVGTISILVTGQARAYIGDSFLNIPDQHGHWRGEDHKGWIRAEAERMAGRAPTTDERAGGFPGRQQAMVRRPGGAQTGR